ncbi:pilus-assembly fibrillin subunit [Escherichia coli]
MYNYTGESIYIKKTNVLRADELVLRGNFFVADEPCHQWVKPGDYRATATFELLYR